MKNIFLIDDDADDREIFRIALETIAIDSKLIEATDGQEALEFVADKSFGVPDVIFLDLNMPKVGGLEVLKKLREIDQYKQAEVIMYTTSSLPQDKDTCLNAGASDFMTKHYDFDSLCSALRMKLRV